MKIVLIDDHVLIAESIKSALQRLSFVEYIQIFASAEAFVEANTCNDVDIVISDFLMPGIHGLDVLDYYRKRYGHSLKIVFLTSVSDAQTVKLAVRKGVNGFITKDASIEELIEAVEAVMSGDEFISRKLNKNLIKNVFTEQQVTFHLSPREKDVLKMVCSGFTIKEAAFQLKLTQNTVQSYYKNILRKFKLNRTADLIVFAIQNGLFAPETIS